MGYPFISNFQNCRIKNQTINQQNFIFDIKDTLHPLLFHNKATMHKQIACFTNFYILTCITINCTIPCLIILFYIKNLLQIVPRVIALVGRKFIMKINVIQTTFFIWAPIT